MKYLTQFLAAVVVLLGASAGGLQSEERQLTAPQPPAPRPSAASDVEQMGRDAMSLVQSGSSLQWDKLIELSDPLWKEAAAQDDASPLTFDDIAAVYLEDYDLQKYRTVDSARGRVARV